jgi:hypothetical protein
MVGRPEAIPVCSRKVDQEYASEKERLTMYLTAEIPTCINRMEQIVKMTTVRPSFSPAKTPSSPYTPVEYKTISRKLKRIYEDVQTITKKRSITTNFKDVSQIFLSEPSIKEYAKLHTSMFLLSNIIIFIISNYDINEVDRGDLQE